MEQLKLIRKNGVLGSYKVNSIFIFTTLIHFKQNLFSLSLTLGRVEGALECIREIGDSRPQ